jgi:putative two-component system response regulator
MHQPSILIVDDRLANLQVLSGMLKQQGYTVRAASTGPLALEAAKADPPDLILLDINMPEMNGYDVCTQLKADGHLQSIPVIFLSALAELSDKMKAFAVGGVDYIIKPFQFEEVQARVKTHLTLRRLQFQLEQHNHQLEALVQAQVREITESQMATIFALAKLTESRDDDTGVHLEHAQECCKLLAERLSAETTYCAQIDTAFIANLYHASPLHDIGKVGITDTILRKPGKLTLEEIELMKQHTVIGAQTLAADRDRYPRNAFINMGIAIARSHHEQWDGSGYPDGLTGENIPLAARIMAVADVYDALRSKRCYKEAFTHELSRDIILQGRGTQFDPAVVDAFIAIEHEINGIRTAMG